MPTSTRMGKTGPCSHCGITSTPLWRNGPVDKPVLCNACGSRWRTRGTLDNYMPMHVGGIDGSGVVCLTSRAAPKKLSAAPKKPSMPKRKADTPEDGSVKAAKRIRKPTAKLQKQDEDKRAAALARGHAKGGDSEGTEYSDADEETEDDEVYLREPGAKFEGAFSAAWRHRQEFAAKSSSGSSGLSAPSGISHPSTSAPADPSPVSVLSPFHQKRRAANSSRPKRAWNAVNGRDLEQGDNGMPPSPGALLSLNPAQCTPGEIGLGGSIFRRSPRFKGASGLGVVRKGFVPPSRQVGGKKRGPKVGGSFRKEVSTDEGSQSEGEDEGSEDSEKEEGGKGGEESVPLLENPRHKLQARLKEKASGQGGDPIFRTVCVIDRPPVAPRQLPPGQAGRKSLSKEGPSNGDSVRLQNVLSNSEVSGALASVPGLFVDAAFDAKAKPEAANYEKVWGEKLGPLEEVDEDGPSGSGAQISTFKSKQSSYPTLSSPTSPASFPSARPESQEPAPRAAAYLAKDDPLEAPSSSLFTDAFGLGKGKLSIVVPDDAKLDELPSLGRLDSTRSLLAGATDFEQQLKGSGAAFEGIVTPTLGNLRRAFADPMWDSLVMDSQLLVGAGRLSCGSLLEIGESPR